MLESTALSRYELRHTAASLPVEAGGHMMHVARQLGHSSTRMLLSTICTAST